jgi:hypothetical protein
MKLDKTLSNYLTTIELLLPFSPQKGFEGILKEVLGYYLLFFYIFLIFLNQLLIY